MGSLFRFVKFILIFGLLAAAAITLSVGFAAVALFFLIFSRIFGRKPRATFRVYTTRGFEEPFVFDRPPMKDVTPKRAEALPRPDA